MLFRICTAIFIYPPAEREKKKKKKEKKRKKKKKQEKKRKKKKKKTFSRSLLIQKLFMPNNVYPPIKIFQKKKCRT